MPNPNPVTPDEVDRIKALHAAGKSCNGIARELGRAPSTVATHARALGLSWDAGRTAAATEAKVASNRDRRAKLISRLYDRADKIMDRLDAETFKYVGLDKDGRARTNVIDADAIPGSEERALFGMVHNALATAARMEAVDAGMAGNTEARGILGNLSDALQHAYGQLSHAGGTPTADDLERELDT